MAITMNIMSFIMPVIVISMRTRKLTNRLHTGQAISSHTPPSSIAFQTFHVMIVSMMTKTWQSITMRTTLVYTRQSGCFL